MDKDLPETRELNRPPGRSLSARKKLGRVAKALTKYNFRKTLKTLMEECRIGKFLVTSKAEENSLIYELRGNFWRKVRHQHIDAFVADKYFRGYSKLYNFVDAGLEHCKQELSVLLLPILAQIYTKFLKMNNEEGTGYALKLCEIYGVDDGYFPGGAISHLMATNTADDVKKKFPQTKFRMSMEVFKYFHSCFRTRGVITDICTNDLCLHIYVGNAKFFPTLYAKAVHLTNAQRYCFELSRSESDDSIKSEVSAKPNFIMWSRLDANGAPSNRAPLPTLPPALDTIRGARETITLSNCKFPSICCYTALNAMGTVTCAEISEEGLMLAVGLSTSLIRIWSLTPLKLRSMKLFKDLNKLDRDLPNMLPFMLDETREDTFRDLPGHSDVVYRVTFSADTSLLLSCSGDHSIRLWSLLIWKCVAVYKSGTFPIWDVSFSPKGYYFASCSFDKTACLWAIDSLTPLRVFMGHISDIDCVLMHPNSNFVATGSTDCVIRLWDVSDGKCIRILLGHKTAVSALKFSNCGRFLVSGSRDGEIKVWDMRSSLLITNLPYHTGTIHSFCFNRKGNLLAASGSDCRLSIWNFSKLIDDLRPDEMEISENDCDDTKTEKNYLQCLSYVYPSKCTPFYSVIFTKTDLLLAMGPFSPPKQK